MPWAGLVPALWTPRHVTAGTHKGAPTTVGGIWTGCFHRNPPWPLQGHIKSHENESRSGRRPPDKGGWGVTSALGGPCACPVGARRHGTAGTHKGCPYDGWGHLDGLFW